MLALLFETAFWIQRLLHARKGQRPFCALIWGDLNNRLDAIKELASHSKKKGSKWELLDSGVDLLAGMIDDPALRRELLTKDALLYSGVDLTGRPFITPDCNVLLRELFYLHVDAVQLEGLPVPLPSYKRSPLDILVSSRLGCDVRFRELVHHQTTEQIGAGGLQVAQIQDKRWAYFGWIVRGTDVQRNFGHGTYSSSIKKDSDDGETDSTHLQRQGSKSRLSVQHEEIASPAYLQLGWPDGVGVYRGATAATKLLGWETEEQVGVNKRVKCKAQDILEI